MPLRVAVVEIPTYFRMCCNVSIGHGLPPIGTGSASTPLAWFIWFIGCESEVVYIIAIARNRRRNEAFYLKLILGESKFNSFSFLYTENTLFET
jgi:hypothetical protein